MLTVCTSSTASDLTTATSVKALLGVTGTSDDTLFGTLVTRATAAIEGVLGRPVVQAVYQETVPAYGGSVLQLTRTPVRVILRMFDSTSTGTATEYCSTSYRIEDADAGQISPTNNSGFAWTAPVLYQFTNYVIPRTETRPWLVEYAAGYVPADGTTSTQFGTTSTGCDIPADWQQAADETVKAWYLGRSQDSAITSVSVGSLSVGYGKAGRIDEGPLPAAAMRLLGRSRRWS